MSELADRDYQVRVWVNYVEKAVMTLSYGEAICMLFDDCVVGDYLKDREILFDRATTAAFHELDIAVNAVSESDEKGNFRPREEILNDPLMEVIRQKAAKVLALIQASDGKESTIEIIE